MEVIILIGFCAMSFLLGRASVRFPASNGRDYADYVACLERAKQAQKEAWIASQK